MAKYDYAKVSISEYKHQLCLFFLALITLFLFLALYSYNPHDTSWFSYASNQPLMTNWCGVLGSQAAALLFYLFGGASFLFVVLLLFVAYVLWHRMWHYEWE